MLVYDFGVKEHVAEAHSNARLHGRSSSKYSLIQSIVDLVGELATPRVRELRARPPTPVVDGLVDVYSSLRATHREGLLLIPLPLLAH
jgi:hypothetical protein